MVNKTMSEQYQIHIREESLRILDHNFFTRCNPSRLSLREDSLPLPHKSYSSLLGRLSYPHRVRSIVSSYNLHLQEPLYSTPIKTLKSSVKGLTSLFTVGQCSSDTVFYFISPSVLGPPRPETSVKPKAQSKDINILSNRR